MKRHQKRDIDKVEGALAAAHRIEKQVEVRSAWQENLMNSIRTSHRIRPAESRPDGFERLVLRFAASACLLAFLFLFYAYHTDISSGDEIAGMVLDDMTGVAITQTFDLL